MIMESAKCAKCGKEYCKPSPYGTYHCSRCNKLLGSICQDCLPKTTCSCGGKPVDRTAEFYAKNNIIA
jgi:hypothetical protein